MLRDVEMEEGVFLFRSQNIVSLVGEVDRLKEAWDAKKEAEHTRQQQSQQDDDDDKRKKEQKTTSRAGARAGDAKLEKKSFRNLWISRQRSCKADDDEDDSKKVDDEGDMQEMK